MNFNITTIKPEWEKLAPHEAISVFHFKWQREICEVNTLLRAIWMMKLYMYLYASILGYTTYMSLIVCDAYVFGYSISVDTYLLLIIGFAAFSITFTIHMTYYRNATNQCYVVLLSLSLAEDIKDDYEIVSKINAKHHAIIPLKTFFTLAKKTNTTIWT